MPSIDPNVAPSRSRRRSWLLGCGILAILFGVAVAILLRDEAPPDISDLLLPDVAPVAPEESCEAALIALHAARGAPRDWHDDFPALQDLPEPWLWFPLARDEWQISEWLAALDEAYTNEAVPLDRIDDALARPHGGWTIMADPSTPLPLVDLRDLAQELQWRALWRSLRGDHTGAAHDAERVLRLGDRMVREGGTSLIQVLVGASIVGMGWTMLETLSAEVPLPPDLVDRLIARRPLFDEHPDLFARAFRYEFRFGANVFGALAADEIDHELFLTDAPFISVWFKQNRTTRLLAEFYRDGMRRMQQLPCERDALDPRFEPQGAWRRAILTVNSGELLLADLLIGLDSILARSDRLQVLDELSRWRFALLRHERRYGALPESLAALVEAAPELGTVPIDRYSGEPIGYDPVRRLIWSVGADGIDQDAADVGLRTEERVPWYEVADAIFPIPETD